MTNRSVEESDADAGGEALAEGLDGGEGGGYLEDVLGCFIEAVFGYLGTKAACSGEDFGYAGCSHAAEERVVC